MPDPATKPETPNTPELLSRSAALCCHLLSAVLLALAYPRPGWSLLAFVALAPSAFAVLRTRATWRMLWTAYLVWTPWWLFMLRWLTEVTLGGTVTLAFVCAVYTAVGFLLLHRIHRRFRVPATLTLPMVIATMELVRSLFPAGGFAWFFLGHTVAPANTFLPIAQVADLFGEITVSIIVATTSGFVVDLLINPWRIINASDAPRKRVNPSVVVAVIIWTLATPGAILYGLYRIAETDRVIIPGPVIALVQTNVPQSNKISPSPESMINDWRKLSELHIRAARAKPPSGMPGERGGGADVVVWPETVVPAAINPAALRFYRTTDTYLQGLDEFHDAIRLLAQTGGVPILVGAPAELEHKIHNIEDDKEGDGGSYLVVADKRFNSLFYYDADGNQKRERYDKIHRVPFGEYIPWVDSIPFLKRLFTKYLSPYDFDYSLTPGREIVHFELERQDGSTAKVATPICFEDAVARLCRRMAKIEKGGTGDKTKKKIDAFINVTNDGWYPGSQQGLQHLHIASFRCIENRVPMARAVNTGVSGYIDSAGRVIHLLNIDGQTQEVETVAARMLPTDPRTTLYARVGHTPIAILAIVTVLWFAIACFPTKRRPLVS